jgi:hypothetical protein
VLTQRYHVLLLACAAGAAAWLWPQTFSGVCAGGVLMGINFWAFRALGRRLFSPSNGSQKTTYAWLLLAKQLGALVLMSLILVVLKPHIAGFAVGMATLLVGVLAAMLHQAVQSKSAPAS